MSQFGEIAHRELTQTPAHHNNVEIDYHVIMPDHLHVVWQFNDDGTARRATTSSQRSSHLSVVVGGFKSAAARGINQIRGAPGGPVWQKNYYERVIRDERELHDLREYLTNNPLKWEMIHRRT